MFGVMVFWGEADEAVEFVLELAGGGGGKAATWVLGRVPTGWKGHRSIPLDCLPRS